MKKYAIEAARDYAWRVRRWAGKPCGHIYCKKETYIVERENGTTYEAIKNIRGSEERCRGVMEVFSENRPYWQTMQVGEANHWSSWKSIELRRVRSIARCNECGQEFGGKWFEEEPPTK